MQITDKTPVIYETGTIWAYDFAPDMEAARAYAARLTAESGKAYSIAEYAAFQEMATLSTLARFPLCEVTESFYEAQLNCLPPMHRTNAMGFFICEMVNASVTTQFASYRGKFFAAYVDLADRSTWIEPSKIDALASAA